MWSSSPSPPLNRTGGDPARTARSSGPKLLGVQWAILAQMCLQRLMLASLTLASRRLCWDKVGLHVHRESSGRSAMPSSQDACYFGHVQQNSDQRAPHDLGHLAAMETPGADGLRPFFLG